MENATLNIPPQMEMDTEDQEVFRRVWERVMPEPRSDSPIEVAPTTVDLGGDLPCACVCPVTQVDRTPELVEDVPSPHRGSDFPDAAGVSRLGPSSAPYGGRLQRQVTDALECWQLYRTLSRRLSGRCGRTLAVMASEKHHAARRLAAAHFLISGVRFWPVDRLAVPRIASCLGAIRDAYQAEQQREQAYLLSAADVTDEALSELFHDLAGQSVDHASLLRGILEQSQF